MKKALLILALAFILGGVETSRAQNSDLNNPDVQSVSLGVNKSKQLFDRDLTVRVLMVVEDSRCPENVQCIQAGNAKVRLAVRKGSDPSSIVEVSINGGNPVNVEGYSIKLDSLTPTPKTSAPIKSKQYVATISVERSAATASVKKNK